MKAAIRHTYGSADGVQILEVDRPTPGDDDVLLEVRAVSINASDWESLTGNPAYVRMWGLFTPKYKVLGSDVAGRVVAVGKNVEAWKGGDEVYGDVLGRWGGLAEYAAVPADALTLKPESMSFDVAAAIPQAATSALQGLRDKGRLRAEERVLINGAGGGAGSFAIQVAKHDGAEVTAVDHASKLDVMRCLGADHVIDYAEEDFTENGERYDLVVDFVATRSVFACRRALAASGRYVAVGGSVPRLLALAFLGPLLSLGSRKLGVLGAVANKDLDVMAALVAEGAVDVAIDKKYPLTEAAEALRHVGEGRARGKVVVTL